MRVRWLGSIVLLGLFSAVALAHGNKVHVRGTIEKVGADAVQIKTPDGKSVEVKLTTATVYILHVADKSAKPSDSNTDKPAKAGDLAVGDLVVIHATPKGDTLEADEVKFTIPIAASPAAASQKPKS